MKSKDFNNVKPQDWIKRRIGFRRVELIFSDFTIEFRVGGGGWTFGF